MRNSPSPPLVTIPVQLGDVVCTRARTSPLGELGVDHYGVVVDVERRLLIHNALPCVQFVTWEQFANGVVYIKRRAEPGHEHEVLMRALSLLGKKYDLLAFNCEHLASYAAIGEMKSPQVRKAGLLAGGVAAVWWLLTALRPTKFDRRVGQYRDKSTGRFAGR